MNVSDFVFFFGVFRIFSNFPVVVQEKNEVKFFKDILSDMPALNFKVLNFLLKFFKKVNQFEDKNLMSAKNIAICITPCILRGMDNNQQKSSADLHKEIAKSFILVNCMRKMLENYEELFGEEEEQEDTKRKLENCLRRKTLVIQEMKMYAKNEEEKLAVSAKQN